MSTVHTNKSKVEISQNFVAFSECMNFKIWQLRFVRARAVDFNTYMGLLAEFWLVLVFWIRSIYFLEFISKFKLCIVFVTRFLNLYCCVHWLFEVHAGNKVLFKHAILPNVIIYKSRGEPFLCNRIWCLGWFWAGWQYWKLLNFLISALASKKSSNKKNFII